MKKILVIGQDGMLGGELYLKLVNNGKYNVYKTTIETLNICNREAVINEVKKIKPYYIINCAAYTDVDDCENNFKVANFVNGIAVSNIADAANLVGATLIQISTDYVFDGKLSLDKGYIEDMLENPISAYGKTKYLGEKNASKANKFYILRTSWLYGLGGNNFVKTMLRLSKNNKKILVVNDQHGTPTSTTSLCEIIEQILEKQPEYGIYHSTNEGFTVWSDFAKEIFKYAHIPTEVIDISSKEYKEMYPNSANRPTNSKLLKNKLHNIGIYPKNWKEALKDYLKEELK